MPSEAEAARVTDEFLRECWSLQGTAYLIVTLRYYSLIKYTGWRGLSWDDFLMVLATFVYTAETVMAHLVVKYWKGLANNGMSDEARMSLDPLSEEFELRVNGSKTHVAGLLLYTTLLWILKGCWVVYYARLTDGVDKTRRMIQLSYTVMAVTYIACVLVAVLKCVPFQHQWQIYPNPGNRCMPAISFFQTIFVMVMNTVTDFYLMAIPLPVVWTSNLPLRKKIVLLIMFSGGILEMVFGILRCVSILMLGETDSAQSGYWSVRESFVSFVITNMPMVYPLVKRFYEHGLGSVGRSKGTSSGQNSASFKMGIRSRYGRASRVRIKGPLSMPTMDWGSEENIVTTKGDDETPVDLPLRRDILSRQHSVSGNGHTAAGDDEAGAQNHIVVTQEYQVTDQETKRNGKGT